MNRRNIILLVTLVLVLAAVVTVTALLLSSPPQQDQKELLLVSDIPYESILAMTIVSERGTLHVERVDGGWQAAGSDMAVDSLTCEGMATYLSYVYALDVVEQEPASLAKYGLANPALTAELTVADGSRVSFSFGVMTADQSAVYFMKSGDRRLFTMMSEHFMQIRSSMAELVDLSLPEVDSANIAEIAFKRGSVEQKVARSGIYESGYSFDESGVAASAAFIDQVRKTADMRLSAFVGEDILPEHGLEKGNYIRITDDGGNVLAVWLGNKTDDGKYFCTVDGKPGVYLMDEAFTAFIVDDLSLCMDKRLIPVAPDHIESVTWQRDGQQIKLDMTDGTAWLGGERQSDDIYNTLANAFMSARASGIIDSTAGDVVYTLTVKTDGGVLHVTLHQYLKGFFAVDYGHKPYLYLNAESIEVITTAR